MIILILLNLSFKSSIMKNFLILFLCLISINSYSYYQSETVDKIIEEATDNSQLELLAHELLI